MRARRREVVDVYVEDGRAAVYSENDVVALLSELATAAWSGLGTDWRSAADLAEELVGEFGDPGDGRALTITEDALRSLADLALVDLDEFAAGDPAGPA